MTLYCATTNPGKLREFRWAAEDMGKPSVTVEALPGLQSVEAPEETGVTFAENAILKAEAYGRHTSEYLFAEDSGLVVEALDGAPGIYSARYAGVHATDEDNNRKLLEELSNVSSRTAQFVCVIALVGAGKLIQMFQGTVAGEILLQPQGSNGFGYDPLFFYPPAQRTLAEMNGREKLAISHRGEALRQLFAYLQTATP